MNNWVGVILGISIILIALSVILLAAISANDEEEFRRMEKEYKRGNNKNV